MKRMARFGGLIATSALTLGFVAGPAQAAKAETDPGDDDDFFVFCNQPALVNIVLTEASGGGIISQPDCSRDTFIGR
jgi:hypothetical protein